MHYAYNIVRSIKMYEYLLFVKGLYLFAKRGTTTGNVWEWNSMSWIWKFENAEMPRRGCEN